MHWLAPDLLILYVDYCKCDAKLVFIVMWFLNDEK